jgi:hypothetical protein
VINATSRLLFRLGKKAHAHRIGSWEGPRAVLDVSEKRKISYPCQGNKEQGLEFDFKNLYETVVCFDVFWCKLDKCFSAVKIRHLF